MSLLYKFLNWYTQHLPFPHRGWKFVQPLLRAGGLAGRTYTRRVGKRLYLYVNAEDHIQKSIFWYGWYEKDVSAVWQSLIRPDSCVIDIGANIGYFSILAAAKAKDGKVLSFEPVSGTRSRLAENVALNRLTNLQVLPFCVSDTNESVKMYMADGDNTGMAAMQPPENFSGITEPVQAITLDSWLRGNEASKIDVIKIDIEGAEVKALQGMRNTLQLHQPILFIEIIDEQLKRFGHRASDIYTFLFQYGYTAYEIVAPNKLNAIDDHRDGYDIVFLPSDYKVPATVTRSR